MNNLKEYILEKLKIDKDTRIPKSIEGFPKIDSKVLVVSTGRKSSRESYVRYNIAEVIDYENNDTLILRNKNGDEINYKFKLRSEEEIKNSVQPGYLKYFFADYERKDFWARVYDKERGLDLIRYGITNLRRSLRYIYSGFLLDCPGDKVRYLEKIKDDLNNE